MTAYEPEIRRSPITTSNPDSSVTSSWRPIPSTAPPGRLGAAAGAAVPRRRAVAASRPGGEVVWIGLHEDVTELSGFDVVLGERRISGSYAVTPRDLQAAIGLFAHGKIEVAPWVRPFPLAEGARVFRQLVTAPPEEYIKALLLP